MSKKILLVSPLRNYPMHNEMYPSGALLLLGTILKQWGHDVKVVHMVADNVDTPRFSYLLREFRPEIVGFTVTTYQTRITKILSEIVKKYNSGIITVAGGPHPSALGIEFISEFPNIDIAVRGEGENTISDIASGKPLQDIRGISYGSGGKVLFNEPSPLLTTEQLDSLPLPDKGLIDFGRYSGLFPVGRRPAMFIMSSRGCPSRCTFCSRSVYGNTLRLRSPDNILAEVELLYRHWGVKEIHFGDDTFNANIKWAHELLDLIIKHGYHKKLLFRVALRVNEKLLDTELLKHLKEAGIWFVYYGVESGNQSMLNRMRKGITVEEVRRAFKMTHTARIKTEAFFIVGLPGETAQTLQDSWKLYKEIKPFWGGFSKAMPFPGTAFTDEAKSLGHVLCEDYDRFGPGLMAVRTEALTAGELGEWHDKLNKMTRQRKVLYPKQMAYALLDKVRMGGST